MFSGGSVSAHNLTFADLLRPFPTCTTVNWFFSLTLPAGDFFNMEGGQNTTCTTDDEESLVDESPSGPPFTCKILFSFNHCIAKSKDASISSRYMKWKDEGRKSSLHCLYLANRCWQDWYCYRGSLTPLSPFKLTVSRANNTSLRTYLGSSTW